MTNVNIENKRTEFGKLLERERKNLNFSLKDLEKESSVNSAYIYRLEKGTRENPGFTTVCDLINALNLDVSEVFRSFGYSNLAVKYQDEEELSEKINKELMNNLTKLILNYLLDQPNARLSEIMSLLENMKQEINK